MITINEINRFNNTLSMYGLSNDELPTDHIVFNHVDYKITNASSIIFMDTGTMKMFDEDHKIWLEL